MALFRIGGVLATKAIVITMDPDALPGSFGGGSVVSLGTFEHELVQGDTGDILPGAEGHGWPVHTIRHHIEDILYKRSAANLATAKQAPDWPDAVTDLENWTINPSGLLMTSEGMHVPAVLVDMPATPTIVTKHLPGGQAIAVARLDFTSNDPAICTVSSIGVITGVAVGKTTITVTRKDGKFSAECDVTVVA